MGVMSFLMGNKSLIAIVILIVIMSGMYVQIIIQHNKNKALKAEKATISVMLTESQANLIQLSNDIKTQNAAIDKLKSAADDLLRENETLIADAAKNATKHKTRAGTILTKVAPPNVTKCDAADSLINEEIRNAK